MLIQGLVLINFFSFQGRSLFEVGAYLKAGGYSNKNGT